MSEQQTEYQTKEQETVATYDPSQEPIVLSKPTLDLFLRQENPSDLIALYTFYYYTAKWQKTNQPWATKKYCMKSLKWGQQRVDNARKKLTELGLIEAIEKRNDKGRFDKWYIKINFIWSRSAVESIHEHQNHAMDESNDGHQDTSALSSNNISASSDNKNTDTKVSYVSQVKHPDKIKEIISFWNSLNKTQSHKRPESKVYEAAASRLDNLLQGLPVVCKKDNRPTQPLINFCNNFSVPESLLNKQFTGQEIKEILQRIHDNELSENNKRDLPSVLFNNFASRNKAFSLFYREAARLQVDNKYTRLAKKLASVINPELSSDKLLPWAKEFEKLIEDGRDYREVKEVVEWYVVNWNDKYTPVVDDGWEFCEKYSRIRRQMRRMQREKEKEEFLNS
jgi:hypothetical protein